MLAHSGCKHRLGSIIRCVRCCKKVCVDCVPKVKVSRQGNVTCLCCEMTFEMMKSELRRLDSFYNDDSAVWPHSFLTPEQLASSGFFFLQKQRMDNVQCFACRCVVKNFVKCENTNGFLDMAHKSHCAYLKGFYVGNVNLKGRTETKRYLRAFPRVQEHTKASGEIDWMNSA